MKIVLASQSAVKVEACNKILPLFFDNYEFIAVKAASNVAEQPIDEETVHGARNRLSHARQIEADADLYISIESGIFQENGRFMDRAITLIEDSEHIQNLAFSDGVEFPAIAFNEAKDRGFNLWTVGKVMEEMGIVKKHDDPQLDLSGISRKDYLAASLTTALREFKKRQPA